MQPQVNKIDSPLDSRLRLTESAAPLRKTADKSSKMFQER